MKQRRSCRLVLEQLERRESPTSLESLAPWLVWGWPNKPKKGDDELSALGGLAFQDWSPTPDELPDGYYAVTDVQTDSFSVITTHFRKGQDTIQVATFSTESGSKWEGVYDPSFYFEYEVHFHTPGIFAVRERSFGTSYGEPQFFFINAPSAAYDGGAGPVRRNAGPYLFVAIPGPYDLIAVEAHPRYSEFLDLASGLDPDKTEIVYGARHFGQTVREKAAQLGRPINVILLVLVLAQAQEAPEEKLQRQWQAVESVTVSLPGHVVVLERKEIKELFASLKVEYVWRGAAAAQEPKVFVQFGKEREKFGILGVVGEGRDRVLELQGDRGIVFVDPKLAEALDKVLSARLKKKINVLAK